MLINIYLNILYLYNSMMEKNKLCENLNKQEKKEYLINSAEFFKKLSNY